MSVRRKTPRVMVALAVAAGALALAGYSVTGEIVFDPDATHLDLRISQPMVPGDSSPCDGSPSASISVTERSVTHGVLSCRLTGSLPRGTDSDPGLATHSNGHVFFSIPTGYLTELDPTTVTLDVTTVFPGGTVVASSGGGVGTDRVRWHDLRALQNSGVAATARTGVDTDWILPATLGLLGGAAFVGLVRGIALALVGPRDEPSGPPRVRRRLHWGDIVAAPLPTTAQPSRRVRDAESRPAARPPKHQPEDPEAWAPEGR